jgi:hypothetical protein
VPAKPVASSGVSESTASPALNWTLAGWCVDRFFGESQLPTAHPLGNAGPSSSSRHSSVKAPSAKDEYCTQLMYCWMGKMAGSKLPPKVASPGQMLKCICMPEAAFSAKAAATSSPSRRTSTPSTRYAM